MTEEPLNYTRIEAAVVLRQPGVVVTREAFLASPSQFVWQDGVQPDWIVEAFRSNEPFRQNVQSYLARSVSKRGDFSLADGWLQILGPALEGAEVSALYAAVRDGSARLELEWRPAFEAAFPQAIGHLPRVSNRCILDYWEQVLFEGVLSSKAELVRQALAALRAADIRTADMSRFAPESLELGEPIWWGSGNEPDEGLTIFQIAERVATPEVQQLLREAAETESDAALHTDP
jgi:hypothetical protein